MTTHDFAPEHVQVKKAISDIADSLYDWPQFEEAVVAQLGEQIPPQENPVDFFWSSKPLIIGTDDEGEPITRAVRTTEMSIKDELFRIAFRTTAGGEDTMLRVERSPLVLPDDENLDHFLATNSTVQLGTTPRPYASIVERAATAKTVNNRALQEGVAAAHVADLLRILEQPEI